MLRTSPTTFNSNETSFGVLGTKTLELAPDIVSGHCRICLDQLAIVRVCVKKENFFKIYIIWSEKLSIVYFRRFSGDYPIYAQTFDRN